LYQLFFIISLNVITPEPLKCRYVVPSVRTDGLRVGKVECGQSVLGSTAKIRELWGLHTVSSCLGKVHADTKSHLGTIHTKAENFMQARQAESSRWLSCMKEGCCCDILALFEDRKIDAVGTCQRVRQRPRLGIIDQI
jgi:hypothetical protein